jgi:hypothetical protein
VLTAVIGTTFVWLTLSLPTATTVGGRAELSAAGSARNPLYESALVLWLTRLTSNPMRHASARVTKVTVSGIDCSPVDTDWYYDSNYGSLITGALGVVTALVGMATLRSKFGFQKFPAP